MSKCGSGVRRAKGAIRCLAALAFVSYAAFADVVRAEDCPPPVVLSDGWEVARPEQHGLDAASVCEIERLVDTFNPHAVVVVKNGQLIYEHYFVGEDSRWGRSLGRVVFEANIKHDLASATKSVTSLLVGVAMDRKWITDLDQRVFSFFTEHADLRTPDKDRITLRHLLTMSTGLEWNETKLAYGNPANNYRQMLLDPDPYRLILGQPLAAEPGQAWDYNSGATALLGAILRKVSGHSIDALARETLLEPLGIEDWEWARGANGDPRAASGLRLRTRDIAKIGQLVLDHGRWQDRQIVPAAWIEASTRPIMHGEGNPLFNNGTFAYGYHWWIGRSSPGGRDLEWIVGSGFGGQRLYIVPSERLVIASYEGSYGKPLQGLAGSTALKQVLSATVKNSSHRENPLKNESDRRETR